MKTDDVKEKSKRVKRCYPRDEVYHRFIHDDTFIYSKENRHKIYVIGNYLFAGDASREWGIKATNEEIINNWIWRKSQCIAVIDRNNKRIIINTEYDWHFSSLHFAIPKDYEILSFENDIPVPCITSTGELDEVLKLVIKDLIIELMHYLKPYYNVIYNNAKTINHSIDAIYDYSVINTLISFIKKYKLKSKDWYKESLDSIYLDYYNGWSYKNSITVNLPTLKQIITKRIFTKEEILLLQQRHFYTKYGYNKGISFKFIQNNWNSEFNEQWFNVECKHRNISIIGKNNDYIFENCEKFVDGIIVLANIINNIDRQITFANQERSQENYRKALAEANKNLTVNYWRENKGIKSIRIEYKHWKSIRNGCGKWITRTVSSHFCFPTPKLKLNPSNTNEILTSLGARVTINSAILMWRFFNERINNESSITGEEKHIDLKHLNRKVGIYPLYEIGWDLNNHVKPAVWDWYIQIGCHKIYISDVVDFIKYYHLEDKFDFNNKFSFNLALKHQTSFKI